MLATKFFLSKLLILEFYFIHTYAENSNLIFTTHQDSKLCLELLLQLTNHVFKNHPKCTGLDFVFKLTKKCDSIYPEFSFCITSAQTLQQRTNLIIPAESDTNTTTATATTSQLLRYPWALKFNGACTLFVSNSDRNFNPKFFNSLPGAPHRIFYVLCISNFQQINLNLTRYIQHYLVATQVTSNVLQESNTTTELWTRNWNRKMLLKIGDYNLKNQKLAEETKLFPKYPNFQRNQIVGVVTPFGLESYGIFLDSGNWVVYTQASMHQVAMDSNATFDLVAIYSVPAAGKNDAGEWDDYTAALLDETADFAAMVNPTVERAEFLFLSKYAFFSRVNFIHALPTKGEIRQSLLVLFDPLSPTLWIGSIFTAVITLFGLQFIFYLKRFREFKMDDLKLTVQSILKQLIDQDGLASPEFSKLVGENYSRFTMSLWFLCFIVLSSAYKSELVSSITLPKLVFPPKTFLELTESDYKIGAMVYDVWKGYFDYAYTSIGAEINRRAEEVTYFEPEGFHVILEGKQVIVGLADVFNLLGRKYLTDARRQPLYMTSKDSYFSNYATMGVHRRHPYFIEPLNENLAHYHAGGIDLHFRAKGEAILEGQGQHNARNWMKTLKAFRLDNEEVDAAHDQSLWLFYALLFYGHGIAIICLLGEVFYRILFDQFWFEMNSILQMT